MKKFLLFSFAVLAAFLVAVSAFAADIVVRVDERTVSFLEEPKPLILNDRTYVPVRRVLEQMNAKVSWNGEDRTVTVTSHDNIKMVVLTIDSPEISVYTFTSVLHADKETVLSDVSPIILNDRTMLPIRVIAEALGAKVDYDESRIVNITTTQAKSTLEKSLGEKALSEETAPYNEFSETLPKISLSCDTKDVKAGDEVNVYVHLSNLDKLDYKDDFSGLITTVFYDTENFEYAGFTCIDETGELPPAYWIDNKVFYENGVKVVYIYIPGTEYVLRKDGAVVMLKFKALTDNGGTFYLSDGISEFGYDNEISFFSEDISHILCKFDEIKIDTTKITVK